MNEALDVENRIRINYMRFFAILSVICAHISTGGGDVSDIIVSSMGTIGVGLFFILSGYFYFENKKTIPEFVLAKTSSILVPWLFCGTLDWMYIVIRKGGISINSLLDSLFVHSHYYFLTVLIIFYFIFYKVRKYDLTFYFVFIISIISCLLTDFRHLDIYPYINPFNWMIYFAFGMFIKKNNLLNDILIITNRCLIIILPIAVYTLIWYVLKQRYVTYWDEGNILFALIWILAIFGISSILLRIKSTIAGRVFQYFGRISFTIYLIHMPFAGMMNKAISIMDMPYLRLIAPLIVLTVVGSVIWLIDKVSILLKVNRTVKLLFGIR